MLKTQKSARPIQSQQIEQHYISHKYSIHCVDEYKSAWFNWIANCSDKHIEGLQDFTFVDHVNGTAQTFDNFVLKHNKFKFITVFEGEFQYHSCIAKFSNVQVVNVQDFLEEKYSNHRALIISLPFSDTGKKHENFEGILDHCEHFGIPVCLDIAYWGICKNINLNLAQWSCIKEVTCSLSKPFFGLETHRIGVRFTRKYSDDGISMMNEIGMVNTHSISLGIHFMKQFSADWNWNTFGKQYHNVTKELNLKTTDTVIFALGDKFRYSDFNRGLPNNYRVCVSKYLGDTNDS